MLAVLAALALAWATGSLALAACAALSYALRRWPRLLHVRKPAHPYWPGVRGIAHRGGRVKTPENTLARPPPAGESAIKIKCWYPFERAQKQL
jgi:hypothetical protein